jgi:uncharacterized membrane protein YfcA
MDALPPSAALPVIVLVLGGVAAGLLGALLGVSGGVLLVPLLVAVLGLPFSSARAISLMTVVATSSVVASGRRSHHLVNPRLAMLLQVMSAAGGLAGGVTSALFSERVLTALFAGVMLTMALVMATRLNRRNVILDAGAEPGILGGRIFDPESGRVIVYRLKRVPLALAVSFIGGNVSSLIGIGGGVIMVPPLNAWCGVPMRAAAATSAFMIGVTAASALPIYYARGEVVPHLAAAAVLGVLVGSRAGFAIVTRAAVRWLKVLLMIVLLVVAAVMLGRLA